MDLLAKRYASPFTVVEEMIARRRFCEFVVEINSIVAEETENGKLWDIWLHKIFTGASFNEWKESLPKQNEPTATRADLEATVKNSSELLNGFNPDNMEQ